MNVFRCAALLAVMMGAATAASAGEDKGQRPPIKPPESAYQACDGLSEGEKVEFSMADGNEFHGYCRVLEGRLAAMPEHGIRRHEGRKLQPGAPRS